MYFRIKNNKMKTHYTRVSTLNQKVERQFEKQHLRETIYIDKISGSIPFQKDHKL